MAAVNDQRDRILLVLRSKASSGGTHRRSPYVRELRSPPAGVHQTGHGPVPVFGDRLCGLVVGGGHRVPFGLRWGSLAVAGGGYPALTSAMRSGTVATGSAMPRPEAGVVGPGHGVGRGGLFGRGYFSSARTLVVMLSTSSPYRWCRVGSAPASRNLSGNATGRTFLCTPARTAAEATVSNRPPVMVWFSRVTASRSVFSSRRTVAASKGLMVGVCTTATSTWWAARAFAAASARMVIRPLEMKTTSLPPRSTLALPSSKV